MPNLMPLTPLLEGSDVPTKVPITKVYSAFHPSRVGKWVLAAAVKAKAKAHSDCGWTCGCAGKLWKHLRTRAIPEHFCGGDSLWRGAISIVCTFTFTFTTVLRYNFYWRTEAILAGCPCCCHQWLMWVLAGVEPMFTRFKSVAVTTDPPLFLGCG